MTLAAFVLSLLTASPSFAWWDTFTTGRYTSKGDLDTTYSGDGKAFLNFTGALDSSVRAVASYNGTGIYPAGKMIAVGCAKEDVNGGQIRFATARYNANGSLDTGFGQKLARFTIGCATEVAVQTDGKVIVGGASRTTNPDRTGVHLIRYMPTGTYDGTGFGAYGVVFLPQLAELGALRVLSDGRILLGGKAQDGHFLIARLTARGALDSTFGIGGIATGGSLYGSVYALAIQPDGKILAGGRSATKRFALARYDGNSGQLDLTFGDQVGYRVVNFSSFVDEAIRDLRLLSDGRIVAVGTGATSKTINNYAYTFNLHVTIARFMPNGQIERTALGTLVLLSRRFGVGSYAAEEAPLVEDVAFDPNGKIVAAGSGSEFNECMLARYSASGAPDTTFGPNGNGTVVNLFPAPLSGPSYTTGATFTAVGFDKAYGKILVGGYASAQVVN